MKSNLILLIFCFVLLSSFVYGQDEPKRKKKTTAPKPTVVELETQETPLQIPVPEPQRPANGSLFTENAVNANLYVDFIARRVGDLVFVDVVENNTATVNSGANRKRDSGTIAGVGNITGALPIPGAAVAGTIVGALGTRKYEGNGATNRTSNLRARIAARVVEVLPNGDLRIEALKLVKINKETEQLALSGIVRVRDLAADNSIPTVFVGDLRVDFNGKGVASADNAPGWLFRFFEKVTPF